MIEVEHDPRQAGLPSVVGSEYVVMPKALTAENGAKAALIGEFTIKHQATCSACHFDVADADCEVCGGEVQYVEHVTVPWDTLKAIYAAAVQACAVPALSPSQAVPEGWREFLADCATTAGGMVNGNRLSFRASELLASADQVASDNHCGASAVRDDVLALAQTELLESLLALMGGQAPRHNLSEARYRTLLCGQAEQAIDIYRTRLQAAAGE